MAKQKEVQVKNNSDEYIWVVIAENSRQVTETKTKKVSEYDFETYYKMMVEGKVALPIEGIPISAEGKQSTEFKARLKVYWEENQEASFQWSGFIEAGELEIPANTQNRWALKGDEPLYYISIRTMGGRMVADRIARQDAIITVNKSGHIDDPIPQLVPIKNGATAFLQKLGGTQFIGDPQTANNGWDAGTFLSAGGGHTLKSVDKVLEAGSLVRIVSNSKTLASSDYKYMYSSDIGWAYYDKLRKNGSRAGKKQSWKITKTSSASNSSGKTLHYGDQVIISNANWPKANLGIKKKWLQCVNDDSTVWVLRKEAKA